MQNVVISGTGLYTPANSISNEELVQSFNAYVHQFNSDNAAAIERGDVQPLTESSAAFIEKASGIKSRFVMDKEGILDPQRMAPRLPERSNDEWSVLCQMAIGAAEQARSHIKMGSSARWRQMPGFVANFAVINAGIVVKGCDAME